MHYLSRISGIRQRHSTSKLGFELPWGLPMSRKASIYPEGERLLCAVDVKVVRVARAAGRNQVVEGPFEASCDGIAIEKEPGEIDQKLEQTYQKKAKTRSEAKMPQVKFSSDIK